ncbi:MAG: hypothetical protein R2836_08970 [Chitinophagales bacterium]
MEILRELSSLIGLKKINKIDTLYAENESESVYTRLYHLAREYNVNNYSEDDIALEIANVPRTHKKYGMIKSRFIKKALNQIIFIDTSNDLPINTKEILTANRLAYLSRLLFSLGATKSSIYLLNKAIPILEKNELLEPLINLYKIKLTEYVINNQPKKLKQVSEKIKNYCHNLNDEINVTILYEKIGLIYNKSEILTASDYSNLNDAVSELKSLNINEKSTFDSIWKKSLLLIEFHQYNGEYTKLYDEIYLIESLLNKKAHFNHQNRKIQILSWKLEAFGYLHEVSKGNIIVYDLLLLINSINSNWFSVQRKILFFYIHTNQYEKAFEITEKITNLNEFKTYNENFKELWIMWHTYLEIYSKKEKIDELKKIKIYKVLNSVNRMTKDKLGVNTAKIIMELWYNFLTKDYDSLIDAYNAVSIYKTRYITPNKLKRTAILFDFITTSSINSFRKDDLIEKGNKALQKFEELKNSNAEKRAYEIIYEKLIEVMMGRKQ